MFTLKFSAITSRLRCVIDHKQFGLIRTSEAIKVCKTLDQFPSEAALLKGNYIKKEQPFLVGLIAQGRAHLALR